LVPHLLGMMISPLRMLALDSDVCPTPLPSHNTPVAPLNTYTFLNFPWAKKELANHTRVSGLEGYIHKRTRDTPDAKFTRTNSFVHSSKIDASTAPMGCECAFHCKRPT
jgi:hypothetical protein